MSENKKCRKYSIEYLKFGFIGSPTNEKLPLCLICEKTFSNEAMKPSRMKEHFMKKHSDKTNKNVLYFQDLKNKFEKRKTVSGLFNKIHLNNDKGLITSYKVSLLVAKCGKPHTITETLILPAVEEILNSMTNLNVSDIISSIPLSNNTVSRRIDEMAHNVEIKLCDILKITKFSLQLDESTLRDNEALLLAYVRYVSTDEKITEELLFAKSLIMDTKGLTIFKVVENFFVEKGIPITNCIACATDGAPAMIGRQRGFIAHLKNAVPGILTVHCVIHRQHLVAKNLSSELHVTMKLVINAINKIKAKSLNDRLFRQLCHENDEYFERLLLHTEVRWLSKGNCLTRFYNLFQTILEFLQPLDIQLYGELKKRETDIAYLADIFEKLNEVNKNLQGEKINFIKSKSIISAFISKLSLFKEKISRREFNHFFKLSSLKQILDSDLEIYCAHLESLKDDMITRFKDINDLIIPEWVLNPFLANIQNIQPSIQEELIEVKHNEEAKIDFKLNGYELFWLKQKITYPQLWKEVELLIMAFPSTYLVEKGFSAVQQLLTKSRNRLEISKKGDLRLMLTSIEPDIISLAGNHQSQGSH